ncbi:MAG: hypothetical protein WCI27_03910 [Candidatus Omnitrophota bacterium]
MYKLKLPAIALILLSFCALTGNAQAADKGAPAIQNSIPVQIKIVINENGKENKSYLFDFNAHVGQALVYSGGVTLPYQVSVGTDKPQETRFIDLKNSFSLTLSKSDSNTSVNSKISMTVDVAKENSGIPVVTRFDYAGVSLHKDGEFIKVFAGPLMDSSHSVDIYVKTGN